MKYKLIVGLTVICFALAVGFIVYQLPNPAEGEQGDITVATGSQYGVSNEDQYGMTESGVPADFLFTSPVESVQFSHQTHAIDMGMKCDSCHSGTFQMEKGAAESKGDFNMASLYSGKYCGSCHSTSSDYAFASDTQCARCHVGVKALEGSGE